MKTKDTLQLQQFYSESLHIYKITESKNAISIWLKPQKHSHKCPLCHKSMQDYHGTYERVVQDLPILGKTVCLYIKAYEYYCENPDCKQKIFVEDFDAFLSRYNRFSTRCEDFIVTLALETSCEGAAHICKHMGIKISGDTIIKLLKRRFQQNPPPKCGEIIGVDDWAYKKGNTYCTIVCDGMTHNPIAVLDGRDGKTLKEWLQNNKHVKIATRDRASAYAKVISEVLPDAMQIADRFHLHQNLLTAIKDALRSKIPDKIEIKEDGEISTPAVILKKTKAKE